MSHIHHLGGSGAAADYQDYLERLRSRKTPVRTFDSAIEADRESEGREPEQDQAQSEPEPKQDPEPEAKRYA
ncbi:MAG TPA: hypothetical protein VHC86_00710 [Opitutaceae bacterium]|nr:hypothetical protein [Opitutaceae bacterium]